MKFAQKTILILTLLGFFQKAASQYITVDDNRTAQDLVENVLINSGCANVSNISVSGWAFGSGNSYGYFAAGTSSFPFQEGVLLTTGRAVSAIGPNTSLLSEGPTSWPGDPDLEQAINENNTINATVLEFDFIPFANKVSFEYIFSSEQYLSNPSPNQCNFSDGFAFLLKENTPSGVYNNLAVVPGTNIPVKIPTVRGSGTICPPANEAFFDSFNGSNHPTNYNGQTRILRAESNVTPGVSYHIKLVIADQGNNLYDSAIFLGGGSFTVETDLGPDRLVATGNPLCGSETLVLDATTPNATGYRWFRNGVLLTNQNPTLQVTTFGIYEVEVIFSASCSSFGEITIEYVPNPQPVNATLTQCTSSCNGIAIYNLNEANALVIGSNQNINTVRYYLLESDALNNQNAIQIGNAFQNTIPNQILYTRVENNFGCSGIGQLVLSTSSSNVTLAPFILCDTTGEQDGITTLNLLNTFSSSVLAFFPTGLQAQYYANETDAQLQQNPLPAVYTNTTPNATIFVRITDGVSCFGILPVNFQVSFFENVSISNSVQFCEDSSVQLNAAVGNYSYLWSTGATTRTITVNQPGNYTVTLTNNQGCNIIQEFSVSESEAINYLGTVINDFSGNQNSITIQYSGSGDYVFSIDGLNYQESPFFTGLAPGIYTISSLDLNGCAGFTDTIYILDYPKFFTPNGDGINDFWKIENLFEPNAQLFIFDRYGKLLKQLGTSNEGWDGLFLGNPMPSSDYWFRLVFENGRIISGHFSLKR
ncbi:choice-of-anchor L domain-containing protein [Flavobacterium sp.]|uniref:choice-of-anchor L domain-containing protein n=1 Tax=Flavobacterium sp. TaxID=239 RepID=UPI002FD9209C